MFHWLPENISTYGDKIDGIMKMIWVIVFSWFVVVEVVFFYFLFRYRARQGGKATFQPGRGKAVLWILIPAALVLGFDLAIDLKQNPVWNEVKINMPEQVDQEISIQGKQFVWDFILPGRDNKLGTVDDVKTVNQLTVPVNSKILFHLGADDVIHSFWVPALRLKQDAVPGRKIKGWFEATKEGTYAIACAELCGSGHGVMKGQIHVLGKQAYADWLETNSPKVSALMPPEGENE